MNAFTLDSLSVDDRRVHVPDDAAPRPAVNETDIWCAALDDHPAEAMQQFASLLSPDETARADRFHFSRDRCRYVAGRGILRTLLGHYTEQASRRIAFEYGPNGKPSLAGDGDGERNFGAGRIYFNVSHSAALALFAFSRTGEIGIDVELIRDLPDFDGVAAVMFSPAELALWRACPPSCRRDQFYAAWTRQEAMLKAVGAGLGGAMTPAMTSPFQVYPLNPVPGFAAALAATTAGDWATLHMWQHDARLLPSGAPQRGKRMRLADLSAGGALFP